MEIRSVAGVEEFRVALAVNRRAWKVAYESILPDDVLSELSVPDGPDLRERYEAREDVDGTFLLAVDRDVVGFADLVWDEGETKDFVPEGAAELRAIYVDPDRWGEGIGTDLLSRGLDAVPADRTALSLEVFEDNDVGRVFYEARDFERTGTSSFEVAGEEYPTAVYERPLE